jgi:redox-sensing transcriptional repressor
VDIGVIAVPADSAQAVADTLVENGVRGVWNFSHAHLRTPKETTVEDAFFTQSLAVLTRRLVETGTSRAEEGE